MLKFIDTLRALLFYAGYATITIVWGTLSVLIAWAIPYRARFHFIIGAWTRMVLGWLWLCCGIRHEVEGLEHIPQRACVVFVKHESTWETAMVQTLFAPQATLIKRELLHIPFFGWAFRLLRPIAINRGDGRAALRHLIRAGKDRIDANIWVVLFPEGTRVPVGETRSFQAGGAALAQSSGAPVIVVAHNGADHWPAHQLRKRPGVIRVKVSPPIVTEGRKAKEINALAQSWLAAAMKDLAASQTSRLTTDSAFASMN
ncbi:MAG: 1-acyl-sn-glycerol-3-phosphate acyltransferase [Gammaproteobacteria bacterium]|nr:1-acyl-sn-glycerol-3-phosphate acyltransferase [Gammaproteobacteria bacterium]